MFFSILLGLWLVTACAVAQGRTLQNLRSDSETVQTVDELLAAVSSGVSHIVITKHLDFTIDLQRSGWSSDADEPILDVLSETQSIQVCLPEGSMNSNHDDVYTNCVKSFLFVAKLLSHLPSCRPAVH